MHRLVAFDLPGGAAFVAALQSYWESGDAILPLDQRLSAAARKRLIKTMRPSAILDESGEHDLDGGESVEEGDALVVATSGTTGAPKGVVLTHDAVESSALATSARLGVDPSSDGWLCCLPLGHVGGLSVCTRALITGTHLECQDGFSERGAEEARGRGATLVSLVTTALYRLRPEVAASFRVIVLGGAAPPSVLPDNVVTTYGLTESGSGLVYDGLPLDGVEVRVLPDGEIALRAPMLLRAYRDGTVPFDEQGYFHTGDLGGLDGEGRLVVHGRRDDVIVSGGEKIWPVPVEQVLLRHPAVADAALVGVPDEEWQARAVACVVPVPGQSVQLEELRALVREELGSIYAPKGLLLIDELPRTSLGKIQRGALVDAVLAAGL